MVLQSPGKLLPRMGLQVRLHGHDLRAVGDSVTQGFLQLANRLLPGFRFHRDFKGTTSHRTKTASSDWLNQSGDLHLGCLSPPKDHFLDFMSQDNTGTEHYRRLTRDETLR